MELCGKQPNKCHCSLIKNNEFTKTKKINVGKMMLMKKPAVIRDLVDSQLVRIDKSLHSFLLHFCAKADF